MIDRVLLLYTLLCLPRPKYQNQELGTYNLRTSVSIRRFPADGLDMVNDVGDSFNYDQCKE